MFRLLPRLSTLAALILAVAIGASASASTSAWADAPPPKHKPAVTQKVTHKKARHVKRWTTPPGYRSPEQIERERYKAWRRERAFAYRHNVPRVYYYYWGAPYYTGRFGANRYDSLRVGPCWTQTPIGPMWNCGR